jgi:orotate phosphoribosyltransferase
MESRKIKLAGMLKEIEAFKFGDFTLSSGKKSNTYIDCRLATLDSVVLHQICNDINAVCRENGIHFDFVGGMTIGADPIVGGLLRVYGLVDKRLRGFLVRKETKKHGMGNLVEGHLYRGTSALIVEDVTTTGDSTQKVVDVLKGAGVNVAAIVSIVDRGEGAKQRFKDQNIPFFSLLTLQELLELLV